MGNGKKGACGKEDGLIEVAFMGEGIPGGQGGCAFLFFLFFLPSLVLILQRDAGKGLECGRGRPLN